MTLCVLGKPGGEAHDALANAYACAACADRLLGVLADIEARCAELDDPEQLLPSASGNRGGRRTVPGPRSPAVDTLLAHADVRTLEIDGGQGALAAVESWARAIREDITIDTEPARMLGTVPDGRATIARELGTIRFHWPWVLEQPWVDAFAAEMRDLLHRLKALRGELARTVPIGYCPGEVDAQPCGQLLRASLDSDIIRCPHCGAHWQRAHWRMLAKLLEEETG